ncbi:MAG: hypothetical protein PHV51_10585 [Methanosarcinaceae archaeon]|nr:hypothetical protein [Methanosarcinaceae archaeon]MDD4498569.1 hypothetical protein [Methanosarcinaceae archaeon]
MNRSELPLSGVKENAFSAAEIKDRKDMRIFKIYRKLGYSGIRQYIVFAV